jgi:hypothetical protein
MTMLRALSISLLLLAGCSATPKPWRPTMFNRPPGVPEDVYEPCYERMRTATHRLDSGPAKEAGYFDWDQDERDCVQGEYLRTCFREAYNAESASGGIRLRPGEFNWTNDWDDFMDEAVERLCSDDEGGGGSPRARALVRILDDDARAAGGRCVPCQ